MSSEFGLISKKMRKICYFGELLSMKDGREKENKKIWLFFLNIIAFFLRLM